MHPVLGLSRMEVWCQSANWQLCCAKDFLLTAKNPLEINLKGLEWGWAEFPVFPACFFPSSVYSHGCVCVWAWVHNAWPCWEEWLLYSYLVGTMGARAVSLGSCMDDLRRSPSFIKHTPTCRIDLAKKRGGNSSSSVFPDHKSLGGVPPPPGKEVTPLSVLQSHWTRERERGRALAHIVAQEWPEICEEYMCICSLPKQFWNWKQTNKNNTKSCKDIRRKCR